MFYDSENRSDIDLVFPQLSFFKDVMADKKHILPVKPRNNTDLRSYLASLASIITSALGRMQVETSCFTALALECLREDVCAFNGIK